MDIDFWKQRWKDRQTGFHLESVNPHLINCWDLLSINQKATVFVPLCGKSLDIIWLASLGLNVTGVECSELAVQEFLNENHLNYQQTKDNNFTVYTSDNIRLLHGDYFSLVSELMQEVSMVYDRASLVAMPVDMRKEYVNKLNEILPEKVTILLVTLEYDQHLMNGPPFSVSQNEVMSLFQDRYKVKQLLFNNILDASPRFKQRGLDYLYEKVYLLKRK